MWFFFFLEIYYKSYEQQLYVWSSLFPFLSKSQLFMWKIPTLTLLIHEKFSQSVQMLNHVRLFVTPWTTARQTSLSITNTWSPPKSMSIESVMPSNHLILCHPLLLVPSIFPSIRVFFSESALLITWPKCWSFSFSISPSSEHPGLISLATLLWVQEFK